MNGVADNVVQGRYLIDLYKNNFNDLTQDVKSFLYQNLKKSALITSIAGIIKQCNVESVVTYNYDDLLETELGVYSNNVCYPIYGLSRVPNGVKTPIYHVHGYLPRTKNGASSIIVLGEKEYHDIYRESNNWGSVEQLHALNRNVCFFIGLSMTDPNLRRLLDLSAGNDSEVGRVHFVFLIREPSRPGYESFMERTMRDFGINCIWYNNHNDLPSLLNDLLT
ncbi:SIR2 family protein [Fibrobacter sp. UWH1]|uniref:SIR2 family protein n=1 Tax=Fibrobacter sp. UWH1 TaxID=1964354 RepID=UPI0015955C31|nr:SIR2 family protein [Fibrobacter sp. UWH1]